MFYLIFSVILQSTPLAAVDQNFTVDEIITAYSDLDPSALSDEDCSEIYQRAAELNGPALLFGAGVCFSVERNLEATSLLHFGQVRSMADMAIAVDPTQEPPNEVVQLYQLLFFQFGGTAPLSEYAQPEFRSAIVEDLRNWHAERPEGYQPGWDLASPPSDESYSAAIEEARAWRLGQLESLIRLAQNEDYVDLDTEMNALVAANPNGFEAGTPDEVRVQEIQAEMERLQQVIWSGGTSGENGQ